MNEIGECIKEWGGAGGAGPRRQVGAAGAGVAAPPEELDERIKEWVASIGGRSGYPKNSGRVFRVL